MKKLLLLITTLGLFLASCNINNKNTPEAVTESFVKAYNTADFQNIYKYSTKRSHYLVDNLKENQIPPRVEEMKKRKISKIEVSVIEETDSTATCMCTFYVNDSNKPTPQTWELIKENDEWKVALVKQ